METSILLILFSPSSWSVSELRKRWCFVFRTCWGGCFRAQHGGLHEWNEPSRGAAVFPTLIYYPFRQIKGTSVVLLVRRAPPPPNVVHDSPYRHPPFQHRWQVAKLNWHQNFPKYIISPQARRDEPTVLFTCSFCLAAINRLKEVRFSIRS